MAKHNKKRNVGLLHEQLVRYVSEMTVSGQNDKANQAVDTIVKFFCEGSELLREFKLFSALAHPSVDDNRLARRIIEESRRACEKHDLAKLDREKSSLIKEINHTIDRKNFYNQRIENYKIFATIQALLNEWRGKGHLSPKEIVDYETVLEEHLTRNSIKNTLEKNEQANPLVFKLMTQKFNEKYGKTLTDRQKRLLEIKLFASGETLQEASETIRKEALELIDTFFEETDSDYLRKKKEFLKEKVESYVPDHTDESLSKALTLLGLMQELGDKNV